MIVFVLFVSMSLCLGNEEQQTIRIRIDEESPLSTILFTTTDSFNYRLFDSGRNQNSFVHYNSSNGHLSVARPLDREDLCANHICSCTQCQLIVELIEWQLPYRLLKLLLNIEDINDHRPTFSSDMYQFHLMENVPLGFEFSLEPASDADLGENSRLDYDLRRTDKKVDGDQREPFALVVKNNGALTIKVIEEIDREERDTYQYELVAYDHGQPRQHSSTKFNINIDDVNDNPVILSQTYIRLSISENTLVGSELTSINATDNDIGLNGKIHYSISNGFPASNWMDYFRMNDSSGSLTLVNALDYETEQSYHLSVQVRDLGENSLARFVTIDIFVLDENDNTPQAFVTFLNPFFSDSIISIDENTPVGQILAHISISDQDSGSNGDMSYRIEQGDDLIGLKVLDKRSFLLMVNRLIDREENLTRSDRFRLIVSDLGQPPRSIHLEYPVNITDVNDSPPLFDPAFNCSFRVNASQNRSSDEPLLQVRATDADLGLNSLISYSILSTADTSFTMNDQGQLFIVARLNDSTLYRLQVMAIDHGQPVRLNSTLHCYISTFPIDPTIPTNQSIVLLHGEGIFHWLSDNYSHVFIVALLLAFLLLTLLLTVCLHKFLFQHRKYYKQNKAYHLYVTVPRKSTYTTDDSASSSKIDDQESEEHERLVHLTSDQLSSESIAKDSFSDQHRSTSTIRHSSLSSPSRKPFGDSGYESASFSKQESRPVSLSISTTTTYASSETDTSLSPTIAYPYRMPYSTLRLTMPMSTVIHLAEEENSEI